MIQIELKPLDHPTLRLDVADETALGALVQHVVERLFALGRDGRRRRQALG